MNPLTEFKIFKKIPILPLLIPPVFVCFGLLPRAQAVLPPPDGGYPGGNTAEGQNALLSLTTGGYNTAVGFFSLRSDTTSSFNTATGGGALLSNTTGSNNMANGAFALLSNTNGSSNTATGALALFSNTGNNNTANGYRALYSNTNGNNNTAVGNGAGSNITGYDNVCIGAFVYGLAGESNTTRIANIYTSLATARAVYVNADNKIGTLASSRRFKEGIKPMDKASEVLFALKPVSFRYKKEFDAGRAPMFGLIAEDVEQVDPGLVSRNEKGEVETVRYEQINAMLLNEFLKEHRKVQEQEKTIAELKSGMTALAATVKEQATQIQKVSAQLEASKPAPRLANH